MKKEIKTLLEYNIAITDKDKLEPDEDITIGEFVTLCDNVYGIDFSRYYRGEDNDETEKNLSKKLTKAELAKICVKYYLNYERCPEVKGIYKSLFSDVSENNDYCGYINFAYSSEFIQEKEGEKFYPNKGITRGEALKRAYDYLANDKELLIYEIYRI